MAVEQFDHHTEDFAENWREIYRDLRGSCPVPHTDAHGGFHVITRYADVKRVMQDPETFACGRDLEVGGTVTGGVTIPINPVQMGMMETDPPLSQAYRRPIANLFTSKAITAFEPRMAEIISWAVDRVIEAGRLDFVDDLANPIPAMISLDYFGLPLERWEQYATVLHKAAYREKGSARAVGALLEDLRAVLAERRDTLGQREEREDVIDRLLTAEVNGAPLSFDEVVNQVFMLLNGGLDTSTALIASMFLHLGQHPDQRAALAADPSLIPNAVDEMLRYFTPGPGVARTVVAPVELGGTQLQPGDRILLALGSVNYDEDVFECPEEVRLDRENASKHLAFGFGLHRCLGAFLAPAEMRLLLEEVLRRMPDYAIDVERVVHYPTIPLINGYIAMPATFTAGPRALSGFDAALPVRAPAPV
jgi:cytochrome P450